MFVCLYKYKYFPLSILIIYKYKYFPLYFPLSILKILLFLRSDIN